MSFADYATAYTREPIQPHSCSDHVKPNTAMHGIRIVLSNGDLEARFSCSNGECDMCREFKDYARWEPWTYYDGPNQTSLRTGMVVLKETEDCVVWKYGVGA